MYLYLLRYIIQYLIVPCVLIFTAVYNTVFDSSMCTYIFKTVFVADVTLAKIFLITIVIGF